MIDDYQNKNIDQTLESVTSFDATQLQRFLVFEREHKNRTGVVEAIQQQLIEVSVPQTGYYNGYWFDESGRHIVKDSQRLQQALVETELERV